MLPIISIRGMVSRYQSTLTYHRLVAQPIFIRYTYYFPYTATCSRHVPSTCTILHTSSISELISFWYHILRSTSIYFHHFHLLLPFICSYFHMLPLTAIYFGYLPFSSLYIILCPRTTCDGHLFLFFSIYLNESIHFYYIIYTTAATRTLTSTFGFHYFPYTPTYFRTPSRFDIVHGSNLLTSYCGCDNTCPYWNPVVSG